MFSPAKVYSFQVSRQTTSWADAHTNDRWQKRAKHKAQQSGMFRRKSGSADTPVAELGPDEMERSTARTAI